MTSTAAPQSSLLIHTYKPKEQRLPPATRAKLAFSAISRIVLIAIESSGPSRPGLRVAYLSSMIATLSLIPDVLSGRIDLDIGAGLVRIIVAEAPSLKNAQCGVGLWRNI